MEFKKVETASQNDEALGAFQLLKKGKDCRTGGTSAVKATQAYTKSF